MTEGGADIGDPKTDPDSEAEGVAVFAYEMGVLKRIRRSGW